MCGCAKGAPIQQVQAPQNLRNVDCFPLQYYAEMLNRVEQLIVLPGGNKYASLKSYLRSQLNVYNRNCSMFKDKIEEEKTVLDD